SVAMMAAVTSGLFRSPAKSRVTKSVLAFSFRMERRSSRRSATPMKSTIGWRAATSPRKSPTRPAPTIARPIRLGCFFKGLPLGGLQGQIHRQVALRRKVGGDIDLHHHARMLRGDEHRAVEHAS